MSRRKPKPWMSDKKINEMVRKHPLPDVLPPHLTDSKTSRDISSLAENANYSEAEVEFMMAVERYKRDKQRPNPKWSEILAVLRSLGYSKEKKDAN